MSAARLVRFTAVLIVLAGYVVVFRSGEGRIDAALAEGARLADLLGADERIRLTEPALVAERAHLMRNAAGPNLHADRARLVALFVREAADTAARHHTAIRAIVASDARQAVAATQPFETVGLDVTAEGRYADLLDTLAALSNGPVLASVDLTAIARAGSAATTSALTASLHVVVHRLSDVRARPR
ncbi:MAG: hypothetical protein JO225_04550 [Candidatus Eremiobacteraeota bacterium]|nr:hypothetical protein [Candidatus Eremiobacteraeota bacterium]